MTVRVRRRGEKGNYRYQVILNLGPGPNGRSREEYKSGFMRKKDAEAEAARWLHEMQTGEYVQPSKQTVEALLTQWLEHVATRVSLRTHEFYAQTCHTHLIPALGKLGLTQLKPLHITRYFTEARQGGR